MPGSLADAVPFNTFKVKAPGVVATAIRLNTRVEQLQAGLNNAVEHATALQAQLQNMVEQRDALRTENDRLEAELNNRVEHTDRLNTEVEHLRKRAEEQRLNIAVEHAEGLNTRVEQHRKTGLNTAVEQSAPARFQGWTVQRDHRGYYRLARKIGGKVRVVHIGKEWSEDLAHQKLVKAGHTEDGA